MPRLRSNQTKLKPKRARSSPNSSARLLPGLETGTRFFRGRRGGAAFGRGLLVFGLLVFGFWLLPFTHCPFELSSSVANQSTNQSARLTMMMMMYVGCIWGVAYVWCMCGVCRVWCMWGVCGVYVGEFGKGNGTPNLQFSNSPIL